MEKQKKVILTSIALAFVLLMLGSVYAGLFGQFLTGDQELTQDTPVLEYSDDNSSWVPCEDYVYTLPSKSGGYWELNGTYTFYLRSNLDGYDVYFNDASDEGINCTFALASDPGTPITMTTMPINVSVEIVLTVIVSPYLETGTYHASFTINSEAL